MKPIYFLVLIAVLLASCSVQTQFAGPVITLTPLATITPYSTPFSTLTPNQLADINLESILIKPDDLPEGYTGGQVNDKLPIYLDVRDTPVKQIFQEFNNNNVSAGGVAVIVFNDDSFMGNALFGFGWGLGFPDYLHVDINGETMHLTKDLLSSATVSGNSQAEIEGMDGYFKRCNTIVHVRMTGTVDQDSITSYAKKLDERLTPLVCR